MHGRGTYRFANGNVYRGYFMGGVQNDPNATFEFANGDTYIGPCASGLYAALPMHLPCGVLEMSPLVTMDGRLTVDVDGKKDTGGLPTATYTFAKDGSICAPLHAV